MVIIWVDGASKNNGKPYCVSTGGIYIKYEDGTSETGVVHEQKSTSQRGELQGIIVALTVANIIKDKGEDDFMFVTDSEYAYNTITKEWYKNWVRKGWITAVGEPVKNKDLWLIITDLLGQLDNYSFSHIKGHVISIGKVTAANLLEQDPSAALLYKKLDEIYSYAKPEKLEEARALFLKNHGYAVHDEATLRKLIVGNMVADCVASVHADFVSAEYVDEIIAAMEGLK